MRSRQSFIFDFGTAFPDTLSLVMSMSTEDTPLLAVNVTKSDVVVASHVEWAGTSEQRRRGLLGRTSMAETEGIYIVPCQWVHTFRMKFPIDIAFLARDGRVLAVHHNLRPNRLSKLVWRADGVLELAAGKLRKTGTEVGDLIELRELYPA